jgi:diaminohydroxyphosphoribosylaminopyrimidine deaminase/5-amino-6-(5-phosphoribosylamino)uracil reductase
MESSVNRIEPPMKKAFALALESLGKVSPNPAVGAVITKDGQLIGAGRTREPGQEHAEIIALQQAGVKAKGATLYVTLEPCCHQGRTPPCVESLIHAGISQVFIAMLDPNPLVLGKGQDYLRAAGIEVHTAATDSKESIFARSITEGFSKHIITKLPFITVKFAMSLDGKIATANGQSRWISGTEARNEVHRIRTQNDAIMVGIGTALNDDPLLTVRNQSKAPTKQPLRIVIDSKGKLPMDSAMLKEQGNTLIVTAQLDSKHVKPLGDRNVEVLQCPAPDGSVDLSALIRILGQRGITSILVEGGPTLLGSLLTLRLIDKYVVFVSPVIIGGLNAPSAMAGEGARVLAQAIRLSNVQLKQKGEDIMITGYPQSDRIEF